MIGPTVTSVESEWWKHVTDTHAKAAIESALKPNATKLTPVTKSGISSTWGLTPVVETPIACRKCVLSTYGFL